MTATPISVLIVTRDRLEAARRAVASVLDQTIEAEVVVIDDASVDGTADAIERDFPGVRVLRSERPLGCVPLRNAGFPAAHGEVVVQLDDDAYLPSPETLRATLEDFDDPRIAAVAIPYVNRRRESFVRHQAPKEAGTWIAGTFTGCAVAIRRQAFLALDGYEPDLPRGEEGHLALRAMARGWWVRLGTADPVIHDEAIPIKPASAHYVNGRSEIVLAWLSVPGAYLPLRLVEVCARVMLTAVRAGAGRAALRGCAAGFLEAWRRRLDRQPVPVWAYRTIRRLRRRGPLPTSKVEGMTGSMAR